MKEVVGANYQSISLTVPLNQFGSNVLRTVADMITNSNEATIEKVSPKEGQAAKEAAKEGQPAKGRGRGRPPKKKEPEVEEEFEDVETDLDEDADADLEDVDADLEDEDVDADLDLEDEEPAPLKKGKGKAAKAPTREDIIAGFKDYIGRHNQTKAKAILAKFGVQSVRDLSETKFPEVLKLLAK